MRLRFKVSEGESLRARQNGTVVFRVAALGPRDFQASIYHVGSVADPTTRQVEVLAWVKNPGVLKPGFFAEVTLAGESRKEAIVVPEGAVQASEQGFVTYVVENGKARLRPIEIGLRTGTGVVEILSGVKPQEMVVIEGSDRLADGIDMAGIGARYGVDVWQQYGEALAPFLEEGLVGGNGARLWLTRRGMLLAHEVMAVFV